VLSFLLKNRIAIIRALPISNARKNIARARNISTVWLCPLRYIQTNPEMSHEEILAERQKSFDEHECKGWKEAGWNENQTE
jgi:hypothetical protein